MTDFVCANKWLDTWGHFLVILFLHTLCAAALVIRIFPLSPRCPIIIIIFSSFFLVVRYTI
ncbi:hypothetical protein K438DRAFT_1827363, partial [Mycena galopus ATCC 62051]